eukprot:Tbor_TRINITY_DN4307_c0_g1::TRINITY_DN4307_c0_g1_i1::g.7737::m.7737/K14793/RRP9; ribosomal RNA-processing protein 9
MQAFRSEQKRAALKEKTKIGGKKLTRLGDGNNSKHLGKTQDSTLKKTSFNPDEEHTSTYKESGGKGEFNYNTAYCSDDDDDALDHLDDGIGLNPHNDIADEDHENRGKKLIEDARLSAGDKRKELAALVTSSCTSKSKTPQSSLLNTCAGFVGHNRNSVTACCVIDNLIFYGDKSGTVFRAVAVNGGNNTLHFDRVPINPPHEKGCSVVSIAISDTRSTNHSNLSLYNKGTERSTMDTTVGSYLASGGEDGSINIWKTFPGMVAGSRDSTKGTGASHGDSSSSSLLFSASTSSSPLPEYVGVLRLHRKAVTGLAFRLNTSYLLSCSEDTTLRLWSVPEMHCVDRYFGHRGAVGCLSTLRKERCVTGGSDATMRYWKLEAATQVEYELLDDGGREILLEATKKALGPSAAGSVSLSHCAVESVVMLDDVIIACGTSSGHLVLYDVNVKSPIQVIVYPHGRGFLGDGTGLEKFTQNSTQTGTSSGGESSSAAVPNAITAMAAVPYSDVLATASISGQIILWHYVNTRSRGNTSGNMVGAVGKNNMGAGEEKLLPIRLDKITAIDIKGCVNSMSFSHDGSVLVASVGKEQRRGRWITQRDALNGVSVVPLFFNRPSDDEVGEKRLPASEVLLDWKRLMSESGNSHASTAPSPKAKTVTTISSTVSSNACWVTAPVPFDPTYIPPQESLTTAARRERKAALAAAVAAKKNKRANKGAMGRQEQVGKAPEDSVTVPVTEDSDAGDVSDEYYDEDECDEEEDAMEGLTCMKVGDDGGLVMDGDDDAYGEEDTHHSNSSALKKGKKGGKLTGKKKKTIGTGSLTNGGKKMKERTPGAKVQKPSVTLKRANKGSLKKKK